MRAMKPITRPARPRIITLPPELEGTIDVRRPEQPAFAEDWPQGTYSSAQVPSPLVRKTPWEG